MIRNLTAKLTGITTLLVHSERLANPRDPATRALKELTARNRGKNKTDELGEQIAELEWRASMYLDSNGEPCMPADNILATLKNAARKTKQGKQVEAAVFSTKKSFPLMYDGPRTQDDLWKDGRFFDYRAVGVQRARVMRARPKWEDWSINIELQFDDELVSETDMRSILDIAGTQVGLCEKRPQLGRFAVSDVVVD